MNRIAFGRSTQNFAPTIEADARRTFNWKAILSQVLITVFAAIVVSFLSNLFFAGKVVGQIENNTKDIERHEQELARAAEVKLQFDALTGEIKLVRQDVGDLRQKDIPDMRGDVRRLYELMIELSKK